MCHFYVSGVMTVGSQDETAEIFGRNMDAVGTFAIDDVHCGSGRHLVGDLPTVTSAPGSLIG
jgi:hypothetical protein